MTTTRDLQLLADELTEVFPPPHTVAAQQLAIVGRGKWKIVPIGGGSFALRIEYTDSRGEEVVMRAEREIAGFPNTLRQSLEFMLSVYSSTRYGWHIVG